MKTNKLNSDECLFPKNIYPTSIQGFINSAVQYKSHPYSFMSSSVFMAFSSAIGNTVQLEFKHNFYGIASFYMVLVGPSGSAKSPTMNTCFHAFEKYSAKQFADYEKKQEEYKEYLLASKKDGKTSVLKKPRQSTRIIKDYTHEKLMSLLKDNPEGATVLMDELKPFFDNMDRYNQGNNQQAYNTLWNRQAWDMNRATSDSYYIPPTTLNIFGGTQVDLLKHMFSKDKGESGLSARFLFELELTPSVPKMTEQDIDIELLTYYEDKIEELLSRKVKVDEYNNPLPRTIKMSDSAKQLYLDWRNGNTYINEREMHMGEPIIAALNKMDMYVLRTALVLHEIAVVCEEEANTDVVSFKRIQDAITLMGYYKMRAETVYAIVYDKDITQKMTAQQKQVYNMIARPEFELWQVAPAIEAQTGWTRNQLKKFLAKKEYFENIGWGKYKKLYLPEF